MEFLPTYYAGKYISDRLPHAYFGSIDVLNETQGIPFDAAVFNENASLPFEMHRMKVRVVALEGDPLVEVNPLLMNPVTQTLLDYIRIMVKDTDLDYQLLKVKTPPSMIQRDDTGFWEWYFPHTIVRSTGMEVEVDNTLADFIIGVSSTDVDITVLSLRVRVSFAGYKLVLGPPSPLESQVTAA